MNFISKAITATPHPADIRRSIKFFAVVALLVSVAVGIFLIFNTAKNILDVHTRNFAVEIESTQRALEKGITAENVAIAQQHIANAQQELDSIRPIVNPLLRSENFVPKLLGKNRIQQLKALWIFVSSATDLASQSLDVTSAGIKAYDVDGLDGVISIVPEIQPKLLKLAETYSLAQESRENLNGLDWLPKKDQDALHTALDEWDKFSPYLQIIVDSNQIFDKVPIDDIGKHLRAIEATTGELSTFVNDGSVDETKLMIISQRLITLREEYIAFQTEIEPLIRYFETSEFSSELDISSQQLLKWEKFLDAVTLGGKELSEAVTLGTTNVKSTGLPGLVSSTPQLYEHIKKAKTAFQEANELRATLPPVDSLPSTLATPIHRLLAAWDANASTIRQILDNSDNVFKVIPELLGDNHTVTYLLLIQSSDELRATGGFIGGIGTIRIDHGKIIESTLREVTELDNSPEVNGQYLTRWTQPPLPLQKYMGLGHWYLRDANWWADFPATARQAADLWRINNNVPLDGVIAITEKGVIDLLAAMGPVETLTGTNVDASTLKTTAAEQIYQSNQNPSLAQSALINEMTLALVDGSKNFSFDRAMNLYHYFGNAIARHDILIASFDPPTAAGLFDLGLYGALRGSRDDYIYFVETNVSYNKLSPFIQQDLRYEIQIDPNGAPIEANLTVNEVNTYTPGKGLPGYPEGYYDGGRWNPELRRVEQWKTYYGGYSRLYPPPGAKLIAAVGFDDGPDLSQEEQRTLVGGYVGITSGESRQLRFKWLPNVSVSHLGEYRLFVQRQPGAPDHSLTVLARLPQGFSAKNISPLPISVDDDTVTWHTVLDKDQIFSFKLYPGGRNIITQSTVLSTTQAKVPEPVPTLTQTIQSTQPFQIAPAPPSLPGRVPLPKRLIIPAIKVDAPIINVGIEPSGIMASPDDAAIVGWYEFGPRPGESSNAILAGHVDWKGKIGVFSNLDQLKVGDKIEIQSSPGVSVQFVVESLEQYSTDNAPLEEIFGGTPKATLTLITCGGSYDAIRQEYNDRLIIKARLDDR